MIEGIFTEGLIYSILILGVFLTYRILNFCDMTVDGTFPMGACVFAACVTGGLNPWIALLAACGAGLIAGLGTTIIYTKLRIPDLLSGILMMTMLYSVNIRIMGKSNISLKGSETIVSWLKDYGSALKNSFESPLNIPFEELTVLLFLIFIIALLLIAMNLFFNTDLGLTMGALGSNPQMVISQGVNPTILRGIGICAGNGLAAVCGAFFAMHQGSANISMGSGTIVKALAALMLGEFLIRSNKIGLQTLRVILGTLLYWALTFFARSKGRLIGMDANDLNLITGLLIIICLILSKKDFNTWIRQHLSRPEK